MKTPTVAAALALLLTIASGCDLGGTTSSSDVDSIVAGRSTSSPTPSAVPASATGSVAPATAAKAKPAAPTPAVAPVVAPAAPAPAPANTGGALFHTTANSITLRSDFAGVVTGIDALTAIIDRGGKPGGSSVAVGATRSGNTWTIPKALASYPRGNVPNTWRIRLGATPPAGVTYHMSIMQTFVRVGDNPLGPGSVTYPPTTRR